ncbi:MAG: hypothetical protein ACRD32_06955, partial [Nitrososphaerales archaeon]
MLVRTLADQLEMRQRMLFLERTEVVDADDSDIIGKYRGQVFAADIIADGQEAVTYESGSFEFVNNTIPNIKVGQALSQGVLNRLQSLRRTATPMVSDLDFITNWENNVADTLVTGIRQRINSLICGMQLDGTGYNRLGIDLTSVSWGMPADLKVTSAVTWDTPATATPISDMQLIITEVGPDNYGEQYNRVTMGMKAFRYATQTAEFQNRVSGELRYPFGTNQLNTRDTGAMLSLMSNILGVEVEVYDGTFWERSNNGTKVRSRVLPASKVIFSSSEDDNNRSAMDFANGIVTESLVGSVLGVG